MKKQFLLIIIIFAANWSVQAQEIDWCSQISGTSYELGVKVDIDQNGNIYSVGYSGGSIIINGNVINPTPNGLGDCYITKQNSNGDLIWIKTFGGNDRLYIDKSKDVHVDINGDVYILFHVYGTSCHYNNIELPGFEGVGQYGGNGVMLKIDSNGNLLWFEHYNVRGFEGVDTDNNGNIYLTGYFYKTGTIGGQTLINPTNGSTNDMFIAKFTSDHVLKWVKHVGGTVHNTLVEGLDVAVDPTNESVYVAGSYTLTTYFETDTLTTTSPRAGYLVKYDTSGTEHWVKTLDNSQYRAVLCMDVSPYGNIGIVGRNTDVHPNSHSFIDIFDSNGIPIIASLPFSSSQSSLYGITFNSENEYYICGYFEDSFNVFDTTFISPGYNNLVYKYDSNNNVIWATIFPGVYAPSDVNFFNNHLIFTSCLNAPFYYHDHQDSIIPIHGDAIILNIIDQGNNVSIDIKQKSDKLLIYPCPTKDFINISNYENNIKTVKMFDLWGRLITIKDSNDFKKIDLTNCNPGIYLIYVIKNDNTSNIYKIVKE